MDVSESAGPGFRAWAASDRGLLRSENQDAWAVLWDLEAAGGRCHAFAVFDGVGGLPNGARAAEVAVGALGPGLAAGALDGLLQRMNGLVQDTGGGTTAVIAVAAPGTSGVVDVLSVGDSSAYRLDSSGTLTSVAPRDAGRGHEIRDFLGNPGLRGHQVRVELEGGASLLLCTDGVDKVVDSTSLVRVLAAGPDQAAAGLEALLAEVHERGAPDNATVVLVHRAR